MYILFASGGGEIHSVTGPLGAVLGVLSSRHFLRPSPVAASVAANSLPGFSLGLTLAAFAGLL